MACKPRLAMKRVDAKEDCFFEANSLEQLAVVLAERRGGAVYEWKKEVITAFQNGLFIAATRDGKSGYRTRRRSERDATSVKSPMPSYRNNKVAVSA